MKMTTYLLIFLISNLFGNSTAFNDAPIWNEIPEQFFGEDCLYGCENDLFFIDLEPFFSDPDEDMLTLLDPILFLGEVQDMSVSDYFLFIDPIDNYFGSLNVELTITDGEFFSSTNLLINIDPINDIPEINNQSFLIYDEDCGSEFCDDSNKINLNIDMFDVFDIEDELNNLVLFIDHDNIEDNYTTDGELGIFINQNYNFEEDGVIKVPVYIMDSEGGQSENFDCEIVINAINDKPFFSNLGDIIIDEDQIYQDTWAFDISAGADNEDQQMFFVVIFDNPELIESFSLSTNGNFTIEPVENKFGTTSFDVYLHDEQFLVSDVISQNLIINSINDIPEINNQSFLIYDEDCGSEFCDDSNKINLNIDMFDVFDIEDELNNLVLFIDHDNIEDNYTTDGELGIFINQDFNSENEGNMKVPVFIMDSEGGQSENFDCEIVINAINDNPYFSNLNEITLNEDNNYYQNWAFDISSGAYNEDQNLFFTVDFDKPELIDYFSLDEEGYFIINPNLNANGESLFTVHLTDELSGQSDSFSYQLTIDPVNDFPTFEFNPSSYTVDEDSGLHTINWASNINPGGGNGEFIEEDQDLNFIIESTFDETLFSINPEININQFNEGILTFKLDTNMNGSTNFLISLQDNGDNKLDDEDDTNDGYNISEIIDFPLQINQINDMPVSFNTFADLRLYQLDESTFYTLENEDIYYRYPYQSVYADNQLPDHLRFEWEWIDSLDVDIYPEINKDILMENIYYRLEAIEVLNPNSVIVLADSLIYNSSNPDIGYEVDEVNNLVRIDVNLNQIDGLDRTGSTEYHWRVVSQNYQFDYLDSDPQFNTNDDYSFHIDITLPSVNLIPLYDDIFSENFDLYMLGSERLVDFDGNNRPIKLWVDYGIDGNDDQILFPSEVDSINYIYFLPYAFSNSGDSRLRFQMRDHVQNINTGIEDISFGIINPLGNSNLNFLNGYVNINIPKNSFNQSINCIVKNANEDINFSEYSLIDELISIYPNDIISNEKMSLSFDLKLLNSVYDDSDLAIYTLNNNKLEYCETFIENGYLKTMIDKFGVYGIFFDENHNTNEKLPEYLILNPNYPNPFNPNTTINFFIPNDNLIDISIYNIKGEKVRTLSSGYINSGYHNIVWDGKSDFKSELPSGLYFINLQYNNNIETRKVVKIK